MQTLVRNRDFELTQQRPGLHTGWVYAGGSLQEGLGFFVMFKHHGDNPTHHQTGQISKDRNKLYHKITKVKVFFIYFLTVDHQREKYCVTNYINQTKLTQWQKCKLSSG